MSTRQAESGSAAPWSVPAGGLLRELGVTRERGLDSAEIRRRRRQHGPNALRERRAQSAWLLLLNQVRSLIVVLLAAAALVAESILGRRV